MIKYYSGIGSRSAPDDVLITMGQIAKYMNNLGYTLRSGGAPGSDKAFENAAANKQILRPKHATKEAIELAMSLHPAPDKCNDYVQKLHGRNVQIVLGEHLNEPSDLVYCWTPNAQLVGGTAMGIRVTRLYDITVINLGDPATLKAVRTILKGEVQ